MRLLFIGDIVGRPGRRAVKENIPVLRDQLNVDFVIANGENAAGGKGITKKVYLELVTYGIDVFTMGNHVWNKKEIYTFIEDEERIVRPANYPENTPGRGVQIYETKNKIKLAVINLCGIVYMQHLDCPFRKADALLNELKDKVRIVVLDFHAEATSEKIAMGWYLDGRVAAICGTHTHVQTADERILPGGTAYISDVGMTGPMDSVIGVKKEAVINKFITKMPQKFDVAGGPYQFNAVLIDIDEFTGNSVSIRRIQNLE